MYKRLINNPVGLILTSATLLLVLSPRARQGTRRLLVKGAGTVLALGNQVRDATTCAVKQLGSIIDEANPEKEHMNLPQSIQETGHAMKEGLESIVQKTKAAFNDIGTNSEQTNQTPENNNDSNTCNVMDNNKIKEKLNEIENQLH
ncbi:hypothetical protein [Ectobacillus polymachus]|uniref:hypothetical protein n=1 Tax=Ectobacillus polymachus TaxID=1508806 RepID=UPI003A8A119C